AATRARTSCRFSLTVGKYAQVLPGVASLSYQNLNLSCEARRVAATAQPVQDGGEVLGAAGLDLDLDLHLVHGQPRVDAGVLDLDDVRVGLGELGEQGCERSGPVGDRQPQRGVPARRCQTVPDHAQQHQRVDVAAR